MKPQIATLHCHMLPTALQHLLQTLHQCNPSTSLLTNISINVMEAFWICERLVVALARRGRPPPNLIGSIKRSYKRSTNKRTHKNPTQPFKCKKHEAQVITHPCIYETHMNENNQIINTQCQTICQCTLSRRFESRNTIEIEK
jgi:hypothetical protein